MAKLFKMVNIQNLIVFIVLLGTALVNSQPPEDDPITGEDIRLFVDCLKRYENLTGGRRDNINHFKSWSSWNGTSQVFKENCVAEHWDLVNSNPGKDDVDGELAYRALDKRITDAVAYDLDLLANNPLYQRRLMSILMNGQYLRFAAYWESHKNTIDVIRGPLMTNEPDESHARAGLMAMLEGYFSQSS